MCPVCLATTGLYVAGGVSAGGVTAFLATKLLRKRPEPTASTTSTETEAPCSDRDVHVTRRSEMNLPRFASRMAAAHKKLLAREKEFNRQRDALSAERRKLPMVAIKKEYVFEGPEGRRTLADLFDGKRQLLVYHFMFGPD